MDHEPHPNYQPLYVENQTPLELQGWVGTGSISSRGWGYSVKLRSSFGPFGPSSNQQILPLNPNPRRNPEIFKALDSLQ